MLLTSTGILSILAVYWLIIKPQNYWSSRGAKQVFSIPILTNIWEFIIGRHVTEHLKHVYYKFPNTRYVGFLCFGKPTLLIKDPELIKLIGIKDFDHFVDHQKFFPREIDPLWAGNLVLLNGQKWKDMRAILTPSFSGTKMKAMFVLMKQTARNFVGYFLAKNVTDVELKDIYTRFTNDVIANTIFGVECDSLRNKNNEFYVITRKSLNFKGFWQCIKFAIFFLMPNLSILLRISSFKKLGNFFRKIIVESMEYRSKNNIVRPDLINLFMEIRNGKFNNIKQHQSSKNLTDDEITSQVMIFYLGGFESVSSALCFLSYELAINPDIQNKLIEEIDENQQINGDLTYETLSNLVYLDMVVAESLRKWPNLAFTNRVCTKPYTIQPVNPEEKPVHIKLEDNLLIPIWVIHHDPKYFPNPAKFDPERFSPENKKNIVPYTFLPFGIGPRICIGSRFAMMEIKVAIYHILLDFEFVTTSKTIIPLKLGKRNVNAFPGDDIYVGLRRRKKIK